MCLQEHVCIQQARATQTIAHIHVLSLPNDEMIEPIRVPFINEMARYTSPVSRRKLATDMKLFQCVLKLLGELTRSPLIPSLQDADVLLASCHSGKTAMGLVIVSTTSELGYFLRTASFSLGAFLVVVMDAILVVVKPISAILPKARSSRRCAVLCTG